MPTSLTTQPSVQNHIRPMWEVESVRASNGSRIVRLGDERFTLLQVASFRAETAETRHRHGRVVAMLLFGVLAAIFLIANLDFGARPRILLAVFICAAVALMSLEDVIFAQPQSLTAFDVTLIDGRHIRWSTHDANQAAALHAVLSQRDG